MALAKRETARRGLYSRFFRGPILGPDSEASETLIHEVDARTSSQTESKGWECNVPIVEGKKRRKRAYQGDERVDVTQKKRKLRIEHEVGTGQMSKKSRQLKSTAGKGGVSEVDVGDGARTGLGWISTTPESPIQGSGRIGCSHKSGRGKRKDKDRPWKSTPCRARDLP